MKNLMTKWKKLRKSTWRAAIIDVAIVIAIMLFISWYQNRDSLASNHLPAPDFYLQDLSGEFHRLSDYRGKKILVYFFAPWCKICSLSSGNLNDLREAKSSDDLQIFIVGLSFNKTQEIIDFATEKSFKSPVLFGTDQQIVDYEIKGFPTYFVIDEKGFVTHRSIGYSTEIGMRIRT